MIYIYILHSHPHHPGGFFYIRGVLLILNSRGVGSMLVNITQKDQRVIYMIKSSI